MARLADRLARGRGRPDADLVQVPRPHVGDELAAAPPDAVQRSAGTSIVASAAVGYFSRIRASSVPSEASASASPPRPGLCPMTRTEPTSRGRTRRGPAAPPRSRRTALPRRPPRPHPRGRPRHARVSPGPAAQVSTARVRAEPLRPEMIGNRARGPPPPPRERPVAVGERPVFPARLGMTQQIHALHRTHPQPTEHSSAITVPRTRSSGRRGRRQRRADDQRHKRHQRRHEPAVQAHHPAVRLRRRFGRTEQRGRAVAGVLLAALHQGRRSRDPRLTAAGREDLGPTQVEGPRRVRAINIPNLPYSTDRISVQLNDFEQ